MPDLAQRSQQESALSAAITRAWSPFLGSKRGASDAFANAIMSEVRPVLEDTHRYAMIAILLTWMRDDSLSTNTPSEYLRFTQEASTKQAERLGRGMQDTNRDWLRDAPSGRGEFRDWANDRLYSPSRAERIAITETTEAISVGESIGREIMRAQGLGLDAYWVAAKDDRTCSICRPLDGRHERDYETQFPDGPPAHVGCRCYLDYRQIKSR